MAAAPPPNWYPDPYDQEQLRWWDGSQWTEHRHPVVTATESTVTPTESTTAASTSESSPAENTKQQPVATVEQVATVTATDRPVVDQWAVAASPELPPAARQATALEDPVDEAVARERWEPRPAIGEEPAKTSWATAPLTQAAGLPEPYSPPPPKDRKPMIIGAAIVLLLVVGAIAFAATRGDGGDNVLQTPGTTGVAATSGASTIPASTAVTTSRPTGSTVATTVGGALAGSTFSDSTNVYRLRVAPTWQDVTTSGGLQTWVTGTGSAAFKDQVNVLIEKLPVDISMDDYLAASVKNAPKSLPSFVEVGRSVNTVNGKVLGQLDFRSTQGVPFRHRAVVLIKGRNAIVVTYTAEPDRFDAESTKVQPYLNSVEGV